MELLRASEQRLASLLTDEVAALVSPMTSKLKPADQKRLSALSSWLLE
jgi:hypothetical protein